MPTKSKKGKHSRIAEIPFDDTARHEYLTGFHKRKQARIKAAQEIAAQKEKEDKQRQKRELRQKRKAELEAGVQKIAKQQRLANGEQVSDSASAESDSEAGNEWTGISPSPEIINREDEYIDEDKYTTVTVEAVDVDRRGLHQAAASGVDAQQQARVNGDGSAANGQNDPATSRKRIWTKDKPAHNKPKKKTKKFRYESKAERQVTKKIQRAKNAKQAKMRRSGEK